MCVKFTFIYSYVDDCVPTSPVISGIRCPAVKSPDEVVTCLTVLKLVILIPYIKYKGSHKRPLINVYLCSL